MSAARPGKDSVRFLIAECVLILGAGLAWLVACGIAAWSFFTG
jgi:hypothetical protein